MTKLFEPISLRGVEIPNRITVAPMCQYTARDGTAGDWHLVHLGQFAVSGPGLVFVEATGVEAEGRITPGCTGLYSDENEAAMKPIVKFFRNYGGAKIGMQLAHAGRKASCNVPWDGAAPLSADQGAWETVGPSALPYAPGWHTPVALNNNSMQRVKDAFVQATKRALRLEFDVIEMHSAHGYLFHQFLSPISNQRDDEYGGSLENRMRFPLEVFDAIRAEWPEDRPIGVRFSATDWVESSNWNVDEATVYAAALKEHGCDFIDVSSGGNSPEQQIDVGPGYQAGFAGHIRRETGITTMAVGKITDPIQAETILKSSQADMVALARGITYDPRWVWHAAEALGDLDKAAYPQQYARSHPSLQGLAIPGNPPPAK